MPLASSNRMRLTYKPEATYGVPVAGSACYSLRNTGENLKYDIQYGTSKEIRSDRAITDLIAEDADASGPINYELSYGEYDWFIESALQNTFTVFGVNGVSAAIPTSATFAANTLTAGAATSGASIFTNLALGQWVKIANSTNPLQNIWAQVSLSVAPTSTVLTFEGTPFTGITGAGGSAVTVSSSRLTNGVLQRSASIERAHLDVGRFFLYRGYTVNQWNLNVSVSDRVTGSFNFIGKDLVSTATSNLNATINSSLSNPVLSSVTGIVNVMEGGTVLSNTFITDMKLSVNNFLSGQKALGVLGNAGINTGSCEIMAGGTIYFADSTIYDKYINGTASSFSFRLQDPLGNGYVISIPRDKFKTYGFSPSSLNSDVKVNFELQSILDPTTAKMLIIDRAGAAVLPVT